MAPTLIREGAFSNSEKGSWLFLGAEELFVSHEEFPWFKKATMKQISSIEWRRQAIFIGL
jgi:hypothetical protein